MRYKRIWLIALLVILVTSGVVSSLYTQYNKAISDRIPTFASATSSEEVGVVAASRSSVTLVPMALAADQSVQTGIPVHLSIPKINVSAPVYALGVTETGNLDAPHDLTRVGWYRYGPVPGAIGSAILDGHVDNGALKKGVFSRLNELKSGDKIQITDEAGSITTFRVTALNIYSAADFPSDLVFNQPDQAYLKIITCNGTFLSSKKTYTKRLVVTAIKE